MWAIDVRQLSMSVIYIGLDEDVGEREDKSVGVEGKAAGGGMP